MDQQLVDLYSPIIYFDENEPFFPVYVGITLIDNPGDRSPSTRRSVDFDPNIVKLVIEYAIYFDYDIGHMYELEHFWAFVGHDGTLVDAEASFHGDYFKALFKDRRNLQDTHVIIYSQPGKHAFSPSIEFLELIPSLYTDAYENAGKGGLMVPGILKGTYETNEEIDHIVTAYLQSCKFKPSMNFVPYRLSPEMYITWGELADTIPKRIMAIINEWRL
jgi:hypothetical protein